MVPRALRKPAWKLGALVAGHWTTCVPAAIACPMAFILAMTTALSSASFAMTTDAQLIVIGETAAR